MICIISAVLVICLNLSFQILNCNFEIFIIYVFYTLDEINVLTTVTESIQGNRYTLREGQLRRNCFSSFLITKTCLYNFDPLKLHFYILKLGFTEVYINFLISAQKHILWVLVRTASPRRGGSNEYPQSMF